MSSDDVPGLEYVLQFLRAHNFSQAEASLINEIQERQFDFGTPSLASSSADQDRSAETKTESSTPKVEDEASTIELSEVGEFGPDTPPTEQAEEEGIKARQAWSAGGGQIELLPDEDSLIPRERKDIEVQEHDSQARESTTSNGDDETPEQSPKDWSQQRSGDVSDEYDDEEDSGYLRQEVLDAAAFLATEVDFDTEDEGYGYDGGIASGDEDPDGDEDDEADDPEDAVFERYYNQNANEPKEPREAWGEAKDQTSADPAAEEGFAFKPDVPPETDTPLRDDAFGWKSEAAPEAEGEVVAEGEAAGEKGGDDKLQPAPVEEPLPAEEPEPEYQEPVPETPENHDEAFETFDLKVIHRRGRTGFEELKDFPIRMNSIIAGRYQVMEFLGSAAFSKAVQALDLQTGMLVCVKIIKNNKDFFDQSLDEIKLLKYINRNDPRDEQGVLRLYDFFYCKEHLFIVCELLRANLYEFQKYNRDSKDEPYFTIPRLHSIAKQCLRSIGFLHSLGLIHCDLKPENILIKSYSRCEVKVIDIGSSCFTTDHLGSYVQSRSYRAPEVILGAPYDQKIDIWSIGCILAELYTGLVLFQNDSLATLLARVVGILGPLPPRLRARGRLVHKFLTRHCQLYERTTNSAGDHFIHILHPKQTTLAHRLPGADPGFVEFVHHLLAVDPDKRPTAAEALQHPWLQQDCPIP